MTCQIASRLARAVNARTVWLFLVALSALSVPPLVSRSQAAGDDLVIIVNARNSQKLDESAAKKLFVGETLYWAGNLPVHPFLRPTESAAAVAFYRTLHVAPSRFKRMWQEKQLSGQAQAPESVAAAATLLAKIANDLGAIGFALSAELPAKLIGVRAIVMH